MMKVECRKGRQYQSALFEHDAAWMLYFTLKYQGIKAGIESMSSWECKQYFKQQLSNLETA